MNEIDASGEEVIRDLFQRLREKGVRLVFRTEEMALEAIYKTPPDPSIDAEFRALPQRGR